MAVSGPIFGDYLIVSSILLAIWLIFLFKTFKSWTRSCQIFRRFDWLYLGVMAPVQWLAIAPGIVRIHREFENDFGAVIVILALFVIVSVIAAPWLIIDIVAHGDRQKHMRKLAEDLGLEFEPDVYSSRLEPLLPFLPPWPRRWVINRMSGTMGESTIDIFDHVSGSYSRTRSGGDRTIEYDYHFGTCVMLDGNRLFSQHIESRVYGYARTHPSLTIDEIRRLIDNALQPGGPPPLPMPPDPPLKSEFANRLKKAGFHATNREEASSEGVWGPRGEFRPIRCVERGSPELATEYCDRFSNKSDTRDQLIGEQNDRFALIYPRLAKDEEMVKQIRELFAQPWGKNE